MLLRIQIIDDIILKIDDDVIQDGHRACADLEAKERHILLPFTFLAIS